MENCVEISGLVKRYKEFTLGPVSFQLPGGTILGLIGENGAGKTTLLKSMLGISNPTKGKVQLLGTTPDATKQDIGVVLDDCFFYTELRPKDAGAVLSHVYRDWDNALYEAYLKKFDLPEKRIIKEFSRGMRMKLSLACALAHKPKLLVLDEATAGLDPVVRDEILDDLLGFVSDEDHAILISSHITSDLEKVADYIVYLHQGMILLQGEKDRLLESYGRLACTRDDLSKIDPADLVRVRRSQYTTEALVQNRSQFMRRHPGLVVEPVSLDQIMVFMERGERP